MVPNEFREILMRINIEKSDDSLKAADILIKENLLFIALNRIYYACFYTVTALAEKHDFKTSKHSSMLGWFNKKFVYDEKVFDKELYQVYESTFKFRMKGDYDTLFVATFEETTKLHKDAKMFIKTVREYLDSID